MPPQIQAVIFDLDGTLADSEPIYRQSERWLAESLGVDFQPESPDRFIGLSTAEYMQWFRREYRLELSVQQLCDLQTRVFLEQGIHHVQPFLPTVDFLKSLHSKQIPLGLASGSEKEIIRALLGQLDLESYFKVALSSSEVGSGKSKPAPDVFLECARQLAMAPQHCLVLEDSVPGMLAARSAGMRVLTIDSQPPTDPDSPGFAQETERLRALQKADLFFPDMRDFDPAHILQHFEIGKL